MSTRQNGKALQIGAGWIFMILMATLAQAASPTLEPRRDVQPTPRNEQTDRTDPAAARLNAKPSRIRPGDLFSVMGTDFGDSARGRKLYLDLPQAAGRPDRVPLKVERWASKALQVRAPKKMPPQTGPVDLLLVDEKGRVLGRGSVVLIDEASSGRAKGGVPDRSQTDRKTDQGLVDTKHDSRTGGGLGGQSTPGDREGARGGKTDTGLLDQRRDRQRGEGREGQVDPRDSGRQTDSGALVGKIGSAARPDKGTEILRDRRDPMPRRHALVLSGGGAKGAFQVGVLKYLYEQRQFSPTIITGTSVGSLNAAKLAEGPGAMRQLERLWRSIKGNQDIYEANPAIRTLQDRIERDIEEAKEGIGWLFIATAFELVPAGGIGIGMVYDSFGDPYLVDRWLRQLDGIESLNIQNGLYRLIRENLNPEIIRLSGIKLSVATVTRDGGELRYINERGEIHDASGTRLNAGRAADASFITIQNGVRASSAIPLVFKPELIDGEYYWDGAIREDIPVRRALELGATDLTIILCSPRKYRPTPLAGLPSSAQINQITNAMHVMDIMADQVAQDDLSAVLGVLDVLHEIGWNALRSDLSRVQTFPLPRYAENGMVFTIPTYKVIEPPVVVGAITDFAPEVIDANIRLGEMVARFSYAERRDPQAEQREIRTLLSEKAEAYRRQYEAIQRVAEGGDARGKGHGPRKALAPRSDRTFRLWKVFEAALKEYDNSLSRRAR